MKLKVLLGAAALLVIAFLASQLWMQPAGPTGAPTVAARPFEAPSPNEPDALVAIAATDDERETVPSEPVAITEPEPAAGPVKLEHLLEPLPPGVLEVWVVDETAELSLVGATVVMAEGRAMFSSWAPPKLPEDADRTLRTVVASASDVPEPVRFEGLAAGNYFVEVASPRGSRRSTPITLKTSMGSSLVFRFGTARVYGTVVDQLAGGRPLPGIGLSLRVRPRRRELSTEQEGYPREWKQSPPMREALYAQTDQNGMYSFDELPAGTFSMTFRPYMQPPDAETDAPLPQQFMGFELGIGESRRIDFPPSISTGGAVWRGRVLDREGAPVATPDFAHRHAKLRVVSWEPPRDESMEGEWTLKDRLGQPMFDQRGQYRADGSFELSLPAGRYDVWITSPHVGTDVHAIQDGGLELVGGAVLQRDLTLPGITLRGQIPGNTSGSARTERQRGIGARQSHVTWPSGVLTGSADESGAFHLYGLDPGDWIISAARGAYQAETTIQEGDGAASVELIRKQ